MGLITFYLPINNMIVNLLTRSVNYSHPSQCFVNFKRIFECLYYIKLTLFQSIVGKENNSQKNIFLKSSIEQKTTAGLLKQGVDQTSNLENLSQVIHLFL